MLRSRRQCFGTVSEDVQAHVAACNLILDTLCGLLQLMPTVSHWCGTMFMARMFLSGHSLVSTCLSRSTNNVYDEHNPQADQPKIQPYGYVIANSCIACIFNCFCSTRSKQPTTWQRHTCITHLSTTHSLVWAGTVGVQAHE